MPARQTGLPTLQISILGSLEPAVHQRIGAALRDLRAQNVLIVASGSITHGRGDPPLHTNDHVFFEWFQSTLTTLRGAERVAAIRDAEKLAPKFRVCGVALLVLSVRCLSNAHPGCAGVASARGALRAFHCGRGGGRRRRKGSSARRRLVA